MAIYKDIWEIEVGDTILLDDVRYNIVDTSYVEKPNPFLEAEIDGEVDGHIYDISGNVHGDTLFEIVK